MRRLRGADDMAALAQKIAADGVGRDEDVGGFGMKMIGGGAQKSEAFFGDFQIAGTGVGIRCFITVRVWTAHNVCVCEGRNLSRKPVLNFRTWEAVPQKTGLTKPSTDS